MRTFEFRDDKSDKFWNIELSGASFTVTFGRTGTKGQTQTKSFADAATAQKEHDKLVAEKLKKGYVETTGAAAPAPVVSDDQSALEAALVEHADEVAAHSAYADYLIERGDPRGEFIQVQLALEDPSRPKSERDELRKREAALLKAHAKEWLGGAGRFLVGTWSGEDKPYHFRFARGWLDYVRTLPFPASLIEAVAKSPASRLLRHLDIVYDMQYHYEDFDQFTRPLNESLSEDERAEEEEMYMSDGGDLLKPLAGSPYLKNLRALRYGFSDTDEDGCPAHSTMVLPLEGNPETLLDVLRNCPRLVELYLNTDFAPIDAVFSSPQLGRLRILQYYYGVGRYAPPGQTRADPYPLSALAENKSLTNLHTLRFHPGRDAEINIDELDALVNSKNLPALRHLQVHMTTYGDEGAERIVRSGILKRLKTLDIGYGNMTDDGARTLAACPDLKNLELLNVSRNALTSAGVGALRAAGIAVAADDQHDAEETDYLYEVDRE